MLEVRGLTVAYGQHRALENASVRVGKGEIVVILGANGAGKSTLLKAVSGICEGSVSGSATLDGTELIGMPPDKIVSEGLALVPEGRGIFPELNVEENLLLGAYCEHARAEEKANLERVYTLFPKLVERRKQIARTMSGGEQQMVAIGRAMMSSPSVLTLDEPSLGLSPILCKELFQSLKQVRSTGIGILLVEQNAKQSLAIADRGYLLENAHIIQEDSASSLLNDPAVQRAYLGGGGAAGPGTSRPAPPVPASTKPAQPRPKITAPAPMQTKPQSRPQPAAATDNPAAIAAAAMRSFADVPKSSPAPKPTAPATPPVAAKPAPVAPPRAAVANGVSKPAPGKPGEAFGISVDDLVARATNRSTEQFTQANGAGRLPTQRPANGSAAPARASNGSGAPAGSRPIVPPRPQSVSHGSHQDRVQAMLREMEEAAQRARQRSSDRTNRSGPHGPGTV